MAERILSKMQWGLEGTRGTAVAADTLLLGAEIGPIPIDRVPAFPEDALGVRGMGNRVVFGNYLARNTLRIPFGFFEVLPMFLSCGLKGNITPVEQNAVGDYLWTYAPSMTASNAVDTITLEMGDDTDAYEAEYLMFESIKIAGVNAQGSEESPVRIEGDYFARQITKTSFTGAITAPTVTTMHSGLARLYADAAWANRGTTELTSILRSYELEILTGVHPKFFGSANRYFDTHGEGAIEFRLTLTLEGGATADAEFDKFLAGTKQALSLKINGPQIGAGDVNNFTFNGFGAYEIVTPLGDESNGNNLHTAVFRDRYDITGATFIEALVTTETTAI